MRPYLSQFEKVILNSSSPIPTKATSAQTIQILGQRGIWLNDFESGQWKGQIPISEYKISTDTNFEIIKKRSNSQLNFIQKLSVRYLRPPTPPSPGHILIDQQPDSYHSHAPPIIMRQQSNPKPPKSTLYIREAPPRSPPVIRVKRIIISGKKLPPPPRKIIIERLPPLPEKPQSVLIERWLPYSIPKRRFIFNQPPPPSPDISQAVRNLIIQWEAPKVNVKKSIKYLGVTRADPELYTKEYGSSLMATRNLPEILNEIKTPEGLLLATDYNRSEVYELHGNLEVLKLIDLNIYGFGECQEQLDRIEKQVQFLKKEVNW